MATAKKKTIRTIPQERTPMPEQDPKVRARNFQEVACGYRLEDAQREAERCLQCPDEPCVRGCPVGIDIPRFIAKISEKHFNGAYEVRLPGSFGVRIESGSHRSVIRPNVVAGYSGAGVEIADSNQADVRLNRFVPGFGPAVLVRNSVGYVISGNDLGGSTIDHPGTGTVGGNP